MALSCTFGAHANLWMSAECHAFFSDDEFWPTGVDQNIAKFRWDSNTDAELDGLFNTIYEEDKTKYGNPEDTDFKAADVETPVWLSTLNKHTAKIQPAPASKKRKIRDLNEGSDSDSG
ncbi:hypothetical protein DFH07DRAFT_963467 [Mycena maculata]|uniref:Uncharacterized protein n=1 Tax=Mycena maculata TaxID=230809 RepID=A0AAD7IMN3_9AGAR|nr:hypothetical protein DFH07DRAFT_963467 [Mycena maculata]